MALNQKDGTSIDFLLNETRACYHKLTEFYSEVELNDLLLDFVEFRDFVDSYLRANKIKAPEGFLNHYFGFMAYQTIGNLYTKNVEAIRNGFYGVNIPLPHISGEQMLCEAKALARELAFRRDADKKNRQL